MDDPLEAADVAADGLALDGAEELPIDGEGFIWPGMNRLPSGGAVCLSRFLL